MSAKDTNVINFLDRKSEKEFNTEMQAAFEEVINVLCNHLTPELGVVVGKALAETLKEVSEKILERMENVGARDGGNPTKDSNLPFS